MKKLNAKAKGFLDGGVGLVSEKMMMKRYGGS